MFKVSSVMNGGLTLFLSGRIDSTNAAEAEKLIFDEVGAFSGKLVLDASELEYISSAGLRVVLRLKKANPSLAIVNVPAEVYEIFDMTGFTEMMEIHKAYREVSVDGCEVIGEGANGIVYRIDADTIVKVYKDPDSLDDINNERELARKAFVMGVPTAIPYDVVRVGELYGSVFELLNATSFGKLLISDPSRTKELAEQSAEILKTIHSTILKKGELPDKKAEALIWAEFCADYLPEATGSKIIKMVEDIPDTLNMLHGDFHVKNIMQQNGENLLIDMDTLAMGHPIFEFAATFLAYIGFSVINRENVREFLGISPEQAIEYWKALLSSYFETDDEAVLKDIEERAALIGYTRLLRRTVRRLKDGDDYSRRLIERCKEELIDLAEKHDKLV